MHALTIFLANIKYVKVENYLGFIYVLQIKIDMMHIYI